MNVALQRAETAVKIEIYEDLKAKGSKWFNIPVPKIHISVPKKHPQLTTKIPLQHD